MLAYIFIFICGAVFASFIHVYVTRTLNGESFVTPRSHCTNCNHVLAWYELIPIVSYLIQGGRCKKCNVKIGADSLISEIVLGTLFVIIFAKYGYTYETLIGFVIAMMLLSICTSDFKKMIILDSTLLVGCIVIYLLVFLDYGSCGGYETFISGGLHGIYKSLLYGVFAFVLMFLVKILGDKFFKRESLGGGDIKLAFIMGSVLPYDLFLISLVLGSTIALPYALYIGNKTESRELPFGPFLIIGLLLVFLFKVEIRNLLF